jgi:hypothetical protein
MHQGQPRDRECCAASQGARENISKAISSDADYLSDWEKRLAQRRPPKTLKV